MLNYWMIPRPKRKLVAVVDVLAAFSFVTLAQQWQGQPETQLSFEEELERLQLKAPGPRRDQGGSGARTYESWLHSLGLIFKDSSHVQRLTLAGEALLAGEAPVPIITNQLLRFQYPSSYSVRAGVNVNSRFRVHPFRFILELLRHPDIGTLSKAEMARFVITLGETDASVPEVVREILRFRAYGDSVLPPDFPDRYPARTGIQTLEETLARLEDIANTFFNFIEYTQLVERETPESPISIAPGREEDVDSILAQPVSFIQRPEDEEYFQRRFGLPPYCKKDTRRFEGTSVTPQLLAMRMAKNAFLQLSGERPITRVSSEIVEEISRRTGIRQDIVYESLDGMGRGALGAFEASYLDMARSGRDEARAFEEATQRIFGPDGLGLIAEHIGRRPLNPDILVLSDQEQASGIIDAKAYSSYSITNDHRNRMIHNYIPQFRSYARGHTSYPLRFWGYVAGGLKPTVAATLSEMSAEAGIPGFAITAQNLLKLLRQHQVNPKTHRELIDLFAAGGIIRVD